MFTLNIRIKSLIIFFSAVAFLHAANDLVVQSMTLNPATPSPGQSVNVTVTIKNNGPNSTPPGQNIRTGIYLNGSLASNFTFLVWEGPPGEPIDRMHMLANETFTRTRTITWPSTGTTHTVLSHVDDLSNVTETNETNNTRQTTIGTGPDLVVVDVWTVPASPEQGQPTQWFARVRNNGNATAASGSKTGIFVNGTHRGDINNASIAPGATREGSITWTPNLSGTVALRGTADRTGIIAETNESNNLRTENVVVDPPAPKPDLIVQSVWLSTTNPAPGESVTAHATIKNQGSVATPVGTNFRTGMYVGGSLKGSFTFVVQEGPPSEPTFRMHMLAGETFNGSVTFNWPTSGSSHSLKGTVDYQSAVVESNEGNNDKTITINSNPDLVVLDVWTTPAVPVSGEAVQWFARVKNEGGAAAGSSKTGIYTNNTHRGDINVGSLAPGATSQGSITWTPTSAGNISFRATADRQGQVSESNESNNSRTETINVGNPPPDLIVTNLSISPTNPGPGQNVTVSVTIKNNGNGNTPNGQTIRTGIYLNNTLKASFNFSQSGRTYMLAGETFTQNRNFNWPASGSYTLKSTVDDLGNVSESNESNNTSSMAVGTIGPDLIVEDVWSVPATPEQNVPNQWFARVKNIGNGTLPTGTKTGIFVNGTRRGDFNVGSLAPNATAQGSVQWAPNVSGNVIFMAQADRLNSVTELNESNNQRSENINIIPPQPKPDLVVTSHFLNPAFPSAGESVSVSVTIKNQGSVATPTDFLTRTGVFLDSESTPRGSFVFSIQEGPPSEPTFRTWLQAGESFTKSVSFTWPTDSNSHTFKSWVDYQDQIFESNETNNSRIQTVASAPDLVIEDIWITPDPTTVSVSTQVFARVKNNGNQSAGASNTRFTIGGSTFNASTNSIASGATRNVSVNWTPSASGNVSITALADSANVVTEQNESNNSRNESFNVNAIPDVDLVVTGLTLTPPFPQAGQSVDAFVTIKNDGSVSTPTNQTISTGLFLDSDGSPTTSFIFSVQEGPPGEPTFRTWMQAGESFSRLVSFTWPNDSSPHDVKIWVDHADNIIETNNNNNILVRKVLNAPDLVVEDIWISPDPTTVSVTTQVFARIKNNGNLAAGSSNTRFTIGGSNLNAATSGIAAGATRNVSVNWTPGSSGNVSITALADSANVLTEQNETNNTRTENFIVDSVPNVDLIVTGLTLTPPFPTAGQTVEAFISIQNQGSESTPTNQTFSTGLFLDSTSTPTTSFIFSVQEGPPGEPTFRTWMQAGESFSRLVSFTWPNDTNAHNVKIWVDNADAIIETDNNNNTLIRSVLNAPDLIVEDITITPNPATVGFNSEVRARIRNLGNQNAGASTTRFNLEGQVQNVATAAIASGSSRWVTLDWTPSTAGNEPILVTSDANAVITEQREDNNQRTETFVVNPPDDVDLTITIFNIVPPNPSEGDSVTAHITIKNQGTLATPPNQNIVTSLFHNGNTSPEGSFTFLVWEGPPTEPIARTHMQPGETFAGNISFNWPAGSTHNLIATVDAPQQIMEANEDNNDAEISIASPDLVLTGATFLPENPQVGTDVSLTITLENQGDVATGSPIQTDFLVDGVQEQLVDILDGTTPVDLEPGQSFSFTFPTAWLPTNAATFELEFRLDPQELLSESNESNNNFTLNIPVIENESPDLVIREINWAPNQPLVGENVLFSAEIENLGLNMASPPIKARLNIDGLDLETVTLLDLSGNPVGLDSGEVQTVAFSSAWSVPNAKDHTITVTADPLNEISEANESNNTKIESLVTTTNIVDLVMTEIRVVPEQPAPLEEVQFFATIRNRGDLPTPNGVPIQVALSLDGSPLGTFTVVDTDGTSPIALAPGQFYEGQFQPNWTPSTAGTYQITVSADSAASINEHDETNNTLSQEVIVEDDLPPISGIISPAILNNGWDEQNDQIPTDVNGTLAFALNQSYVPEPFVLEPENSINQSHNQVWAFGKQMVVESDLSLDPGGHIYTIFEVALPEVKGTRVSQHRIYLVPFPDVYRGTTTPFQYDNRSRVIVSPNENWTLAGENVFYRSREDDFEAFVFVPQSELYKGLPGNVPQQNTNLNHNMNIDEMIQVTDPNHNRTLSVAHLDSNQNSTVYSVQFWDRLGREVGAYVMGSHAPESQNYNMAAVSNTSLLDSLSRETQSAKSFILSDVLASGPNRYSNLMQHPGRQAAFAESGSYWQDAQNFIINGLGPNGNLSHQFVNLNGGDAANVFVETIYEADARGRVVASIPVGELEHNLSELRYFRHSYGIVASPALFTDAINPLPTNLRQAKLKKLWRRISASGVDLGSGLSVKVSVDPDGSVTAVFNGEENKVPPLQIFNPEPHFFTLWGFEVRYRNNPPTQKSDLQSNIVYLPFANQSQYAAYIDKNGEGSKNVVRFAHYDDFDRLRVVYPPKALSLFSNGSNWGVNLVQTQAELAVIHSYDSQDRLIQTKTPDSGILKIRYNQRGMRRFVQNAKQSQEAQWLESIYDSMDRLILNRNIVATEAQILTYLENTPATVTAIPGSQISNTFDFYGSQIENLDFGTVYWPTQNELMAQYPFGNFSGFGSTQGELTQVTGTNSAQRFFYDQRGRQVCKVTIQENVPEPQVIWLEYRDFDEIITRTYYQNADVGFGFEYDAWERIQKVWDLKPVSKRAVIHVGYLESAKASQFSQSYAALGPLVDEDSGLAVFEAPNILVDYFYGPNGKIAYQTFGDPNSSGGSYGESIAVSFLRDVRDWSLAMQVKYQGQQIYQYQIDYFGQGNLAISEPNFGGKVSTQSENYFNLENVHNQMLHQYGYGPLGQIMNATTTWSGGVSEPTVTTHEYMYDKNGNRTNEISNNPIVVGSFQNQNWEFSHNIVPGTNFTRSVQRSVDGGSFLDHIDLDASGSPDRDPNGNVIRLRKKNHVGTEINQTFEYEDSRFPSLPTKITQCSLCDSDGKPIMAQFDTEFGELDMTYNFQGQRISRTTQAQSSTIPNTIDVNTSHFLPFGNENLAEWSNEKLSKAYLFAAENRIGYKSKSHTAAYVKDALGSTKMTLALYRNSVTESLVQSASDYDPFGQVRRSIYSANADFETHGFTGQETEPNLGLNYFGLRFYMPELGRFLQTDPQGEFVNPYSYVGNNPINTTDPTGGYGKRVHAYLTYYMAHRAGFSEERAYAIAYYTWAPDMVQNTNAATTFWSEIWGNSSFIQTTFHALTGRLFSEEIVDSKKLVDHIISNDLGDIAFGMGMHRLEDTFAHTEVKNYWLTKWVNWLSPSWAQFQYETGDRMYKYPIGHGLHEHGPDNPAIRVYRLKEMIKTAFPTIWRYAGRKVGEGDYHKQLESLLKAAETWGDYDEDRFIMMFLFSFPEDNAFENYDQAIEWLNNRNPNIPQ